MSQCIRRHKVYLLIYQNIKFIQSENHKKIAENIKNQTLFAKTSNVLIIKIVIGLIGIKTAAMSGVRIPETAKNRPTELYAIENHIQTPKTVFA